MIVDTNIDECLNFEILKAAKELFSKYGVKKTTMDDVAKAVGKGKSTLYYYYQSKNELFHAVVNHEMSNIVKSIRLAVNDEKTAKLKFEAYLVSRLKLKRDYENLSRVVLDDIFDHFKEILVLKQEFEETNVAFIQEIIKNGVQTGEFKFMNDEDILFFSNWINSSFLGLELPCSSSLLLRENENSIAKLIDLIIFGIAK